MKLSSAIKSAAGSITYDDCCKYWRDLNLSTVDDYMSALDNFKVLFTCNTCCIEGEDISYHNTRELFENRKVLNYSGEINPIIAVCNQKALFPKMVTDLSNKTPMSVAMVKQYHKTLMTGLYDQVRYNKGERAGEFKRGDYCVGVSDVGAFPEDVEYELSELMDEMNSESLDSYDSVIVAASYMHLSFERIHPFADGNGRVGRMLMNYYLMFNGVPPVIVFDEDKDTYYMGLEVFDKTEDISGFVLFIKEQMVKTWKSRIRR